MGHCSSKTSTSDVHQHKMLINSKNDHYFTFLPYAITDTNFSHLSCEILNDFSARIQESKEVFSKKHSLSGIVNDFIPEINIEVQKGVIILGSMPHKNNQLFVRVRLEPEGPFYDTDKSDYTLPDWHYMVLFKQKLENYSSIQFSVMFEDSDEEDNVLGSFHINLAVLNPQEMVKKWYNLNIKGKSPADQAEVSVRVQMVHEEKDLYLMMIEKCNEKLKEIQKYLEEKQNNT